MKFLFSIWLQVWFIEFEQNFHTWDWKDRGLLYYRRVFECNLPGNEKYFTIVTGSPHWWNCWVSFLCKLMSWQLASPASHKNTSVLYFVVNAAQENRRWTFTWYMKYEIRGVRAMLSLIYWVSWRSSCPIVTMTIIWPERQLKTQNCLLKELAS